MTAGLYVTPPARAERLEEIVRRFGGTFKVTQPAVQINYALPAAASAELRGFFRRHAEVELGAEFIAQLPGGRVFGSGNVLAPDGTSIARDVSSDFGKPFDAHWLLSYGKMRPPEALRGTTAVVATTLARGYSHWLLEELPRLLVLDPRAYDTIIAHAVPWTKNTGLFTRPGFLGHVLPPLRSAHFSCEQLIVPSLIGQGGIPPPHAVDLLEAFGATQSRESLQFGERLYISRRSARRRQVANEAELWPQLEARGFTKLHLEELTWSQQIEAFRAARVVVAPHGAGLANLVFCAPGAQVVELFNRAYVNPVYWRLAALKGLAYHPLVPPGADVLTQALPANRLDITADLAQVLRAIS